MTPERFQAITSRFEGLVLAVVGDFCLDRYLEIDPSLKETSLETNLPVYNVVRVRAQPGGAGTIVNNLAALGIGEIIPVSFCGDDGEGYELRRALVSLPGVQLDHLITTSERRTFTYCKPLVCEPGQAPVELNRFDSKNWTPTPETLVARLTRSLVEIIPELDAVIVLNQVDQEDTGVVTKTLRNALGTLAAENRHLPILADSRRGLRGWPPVSFKMNAAELAVLLERPGVLSLDEIKSAAAELAAQISGRRS